MGENTDEESLNIPTNNKSEKATDQNTPAEERETITQNQETKNMEVHKHPHHVTHKKKWSEYLLEFLMLFLAVYLGFLAESYHVHVVNDEIEKRNIESYVSSIQKDSANLVTTINRNEDKIKLIDSLSKIPGDFADTAFQKQFFKYAFRLVWFFNFYPEESAFLQMQSSGTLRLIKKQNVTDSILNYQSRNTLVKLGQESMTHTYRSAFDDVCQITDLRKVAHRLNGNSQQIQGYINYKIIEKGETQNLLRLLRQQLLAATNLIAFLKKQYDLE
jgi:hypothetical protein